MPALEKHLRDRLGCSADEIAQVKKEALRRGYGRFGLLKRFLMFALIAGLVFVSIAGTTWAVGRFVTLPFDVFELLFYGGLASNLVAYLIVERASRSDVFAVLRARGHNVCPKCGYLRTGLEHSAPCPECGTLLDPQDQSPEDAP